jgi:hypothetical protein
MPVLESSIQRATVIHARKRGLIAIKLSTNSHLGTVGWPDYMFMGPHVIFFIEFKKEGENLTPIQKARAEEIITRGFRVYKVTDAVEGRFIVDEECARVRSLRST